jgi:hypothetical protein
MYGKNILDGCPGVCPESCPGSLCPGLLLVKDIKIIKSDLNFTLHFSLWCHLQGGHVITRELFAKLEQ